MTKHARRRDVPDPASVAGKSTMAELQRKRAKNFGAGDDRRRGRVTIGEKHFVPMDEPPKRPAILFLYEDLADLTAPPTVFGMYPSSFIVRILPWLRCERREVLHVCSGGLPPGEGIRVDIRPEAKPDILADGRALPLEDGSQAAVLIDPPYTEHYAKELYGTEYPRPSHLLREAARVVRPQGRIGFVHYITPNPPEGCSVVKVFGMSTGFGYPMRAVTIFEKAPAGLWGGAS